MATPALRKVVDNLRQALNPFEGNGLPDGQLLERFLASRDEAAFAALVQRHGPMVLSVCRRVLGNPHDSEDAFQATFLVLAQKARSVVKHEAVGSWLYTVAYRTAQEARTANARRRQKERQVQDMPHPQAVLREPQDWQPLLDHELSRLPEKYRTPIVLCDLEGRARKEVARQLGVPEGTLSSRLAAARRKLAQRLAQHGLTLSGGALAAALAESAASAHVPTLLVWSTAKAATLVAAGQLAAVSAPAAVLTRGVLKAMFMAKLKPAVGAMMMMAALGIGGLAYHAGYGPTAVQAASPESREGAKPQSELEVLRKENELLKLNLQIILEKVRAQEGELQAFRERAKAVGQVHVFQPARELSLTWGESFLQNLTDKPDVLVLGESRLHRLRTPDPLAEVDAALKAWQAATDKEGRRRAADKLEKAVRKLKEQPKE
jgi:RNA polymerase sigma factor (sigma-70 family)